MITGPPLIRPRKPTCVMPVLVGKNVLGLHLLLLRRSVFLEAAARSWPLRVWLLFRRSDRPRTTPGPRCPAIPLRLSEAAFPSAAPNLKSARRLREPARAAQTLLQHRLHRRPRRAKPFRDWRGAAHDVDRDRVLAAQKCSGEADRASSCPPASAPIIAQTWGVVLSGKIPVNLNFKPPGRAANEAAIAPRRYPAA